MNVKTLYHQAEGYITYAQVFESNRDMGTNGRDPKVDSARKQTNGLYKVAFWPKDETVKEQMLTHLVDPMFGGYPRFKAPKEDQESFGAGVFTMFTRKHEDKAGEWASGAPEVVYFDGESNGRKWTIEEDGPLWNGAHVLIKYTTYGDDTSQNVRLVKIGVIENGEKPEDWDDNKVVGF